MSQSRETQIPTQKRRIELVDTPGWILLIMKRSIANALLLVLLAATSFAQTIDTHTTVRHHREQVIDQPPEIAQAEDALQKNDFATAETLLKKALDADLHKNDSHNNDLHKNDPGKDDAQKKGPDSKSPWLYQAWFDLGFALNGLNRPDESIAAYRNSVAAKTDVFESNLNLGLMLERAHSPEAEQFLRAATGPQTDRACRRRTSPRLDLPCARARRPRSWAGA